MIDCILRMVDQELEDFENDKNRTRGLKTLVEFTSTNIEYNGEQSTFEVKPKFITCQIHKLLQSQQTN
jgi:hypothetical protein